MKKLIVLLLFIYFGIISSEAQTPKMMFGDTSRIHAPFSKDLYVIRFNDRYLMYYTIPSGNDPKTKPATWGIGIAESTDLKNWKRIGEVNSDPNATYEAKGTAAPCALVIDGKVNLFYQTYGNGTKDAICHAWSTDGIHFSRNKTNPIFHPDGNWNFQPIGFMTRTRYFFKKDFA